MTRREELYPIVKDVIRQLISKSESFNLTDSNKTVVTLTSQIAELSEELSKYVKEYLNTNEE